MATTTNSAEERLEQVQATIDAIRGRLPDEPGFDVPDPDTKPLFPADDDGPTDTTEGSDVIGTP